ncbi:MAG: M15 family metallopeptidase [Syntrophomonas sp.]|nr:M15 family metallopeptidase [Syntrophomonas sp.]
MDKKIGWGLVIIGILLSISFSALLPIQKTDKTATHAVDLQVNEIDNENKSVAENEEKESDTSAQDKVWDTARNITVTGGQAVKAAETPASNNEAKNVASLPVSNNKPVAKDNKVDIPVSRSGQATDAYKYPKLSKVNGAFGQFRYRDIKDGRIEVDPQWIARNIVTIKLPGLNRNVQVHKDAAANFIQAFTYIKNGSANINGQQVPLLSLIKTMDGTFVTRHVNWNPSRGLSNHSWGTAIDINAANHFRNVNPSREPSDPNLILWEKAFKPAGFSWGNSYSDAMHYELIK